MPFVQTLPLVLLHKELIFSKLQSRLQMKARLSLEPILRYASLCLIDFLFKLLLRRTLVETISYFHGLFNPDSMHELSLSYKLAFESGSL